MTFVRMKLLMGWARTRTPLAEGLRKVQALDKVLDFIDEHKDTMLVEKFQSSREMLEKPRRIHRISAATGDDRIIATNDNAMAAFPIAIASEILFLKISWPDVGVSSVAGNYAESYVLSPITTESGWAGTRSGPASSGTAFVLDAFKLRLASIVRKQAEEDTDLSSKYGAINTFANWVDREWISYDDHQIGEICALNIFDFRSERDFPFAMRAEGGCGGPPPYMQTETARNALFHYRGGRAIKPVLGTMTEATKAHEGKVANDQLYFLRAVHLASHDPRRWIEFVGRIREMKQSGMSEKDIHELMSDFRDDEPLPPELMAKAIEVNPNDTYSGGLISQLRQQEFIMTELDVRVFRQARVRAEAIKGEVPFRVLLDRQKEEAEAMKKHHYEALADLWEVLDGSIEPIRAIIGQLPPIDSPRTLRVLDEYYRVLEGVRVGSLAYGTHIKIFRRSDVLQHYDLQSRAHLVRSMFGREVEYGFRRFHADHPESKDGSREEEILNWLRVDWHDEESLLASARPWGVADPLIAARAQSLMTGAPFPENRIFLLVSHDFRLARRIKQINPRTLRVSPMEYLAWCSIDHSNRQPLVRRTRDQVSFSQSTFPNLLKGGTSFLPNDVVDQIYRILFLRRSTYSLTFFFDKPNIVRRTYGFFRDRDSLMKTSGGWIGKELLRNGHGGIPFALMTRKTLRDYLAVKAKAVRLSIDVHEI